MILPRVIAMIIAMQSLVACANNRVYEWTEAVKLADGTTVTARRSVEYEASADLRGGQDVSWLQTKSRLITSARTSEKREVEFSSTLTPLALEIGAGQAVYLVCIAGSGLALKEWKLPAKEPYVAFKLHQGSWQRVGMTDVPAGVRPNLLVSTRTLFFEKGGKNGMHVSQKVKDELDSNPAIDIRFRSIVR